MSKTLAIFGATGQQGGSVIEHVLESPELSRQYKIRAITRDPTSEKAKRLGSKAEVVYGDTTNPTSIKAALTDVHTVFIVTAPMLNPDVEYDTVKTIADIAVEKNAKYIIFSTLPSISELSGGKYTKVAPFDVKVKAEQYIRGLPIQSAFCSLGSFMENFEGASLLAPRKEEDGTWAVTLHVSSKVEWPLVNARRDTGKFVGAILAEPDKYVGKTFCGATKLYSLDEIIAIISKATGEDIVYKRVSIDDCKKRMSLPDGLADMFLEMISFLDETGYFGPDSKELVAWAVDNAQGKLSNFEEYLQEHPLQLE